MGRMKRGGMESLVFLGWLAKEDIESVWWDSPFVTFYCFDNLDEVRHWSPKGLGTIVVWILMNKQLTLLLATLNIVCALPSNSDFPVDLQGVNPISS